MTTGAKDAATAANGDSAGEAIANHIALFPRHPDLHRLLGGVHQRRVSRVGAPALVRMIGLWRPVRGTDDDAAQSPVDATTERQAVAGNAMNPAAADARPQQDGRTEEENEYSESERDPVAARLQDQPATETEEPAAPEQPEEQTAANEEQHRLARIDIAIASAFVMLNSGRLRGVTDVRSWSHNPGENCLRLFGGKVYLDAERWAGGPGLDDLVVKAWEGNSDLNPHRAIKIYFKWHGVRSIFHFELHTEYLAILVVLDFSAAAVSHPAAARLNQICRGFGPADPKREAKACQDDLYFKVWNDLESLIQSALRDKPDILGRRFADIRGIVLTRPPRGEPGASSFRPVLPWPEEREELLEGGSGRCKVEDLNAIVDLLTNRKQTRNGEARKAGNKNGSDEQANAQFTLSALLDDDRPGGMQGGSAVGTQAAGAGQRAIFATAMGDQPEIPPDQEPDPLCYLLYADPVNRWQLGRMIYRINRAGLNRLAAAMHYDNLRQIGVNLNDAERRLERAMKGAVTGNVIKSLTADLKEIHKSLAEVAKDLVTDGPIEYRVERSRYYFAQWKRVVGALRIARIAGYQPYQEFVEQRLGPAFEFIDRLGTRYRRVSRNVTDLESRLQSLQTTRSTTRIERMQEIAEVALFAALLPYYVCYVAAQATDHWVNKQAWWIAGALWGVGYLDYWIAVRRGRKKREAGIAASGLMLSLMILGLLLAWLFLNAPPWDLVTHKSAY